MIKEALLVGINAAVALGDDVSANKLRAGFLSLADWLKLNDNERSVLYIFAVYQMAGPTPEGDKGELLRRAANAIDYEMLKERAKAQYAPLLKELVLSDQGSHVHKKTRPDGPNLTLNRQGLSLSGCPGAE